ncbi:MAG: 50S ribosomal protein L16 [Thermoplasmata archaeon]|nr:50S ribosomal protein L16 [Thermoplasmata archaeon]
MAGRKPAKMYRRAKGQSYTRRKYMGGVPHLRITNFETGNKTRTDFPVEMILRVNDACQIRHNSLEAARIASNRYIQRKAGAQGYFLKIRVYPHEVIRENKMATGAGADRISSGMRGAFGKPVGTAARVKKNQAIITIRTNQANFQDAKTALWKAGLKISSPCRIEIVRGEEIL